MSLITLFVYLLIFLVVAGLIYYIITLLPLPQPFKNIAIIVFLLLCVLLLLYWLLGAMPPLRTALLSRLTYAAAT